MELLILRNFLDETMWGKEKRKGKGKEKELVCPGAGQQHQDPVTEMQAPHLPHAATDRSGGGAGLLILIIMVIISNVNVTVLVPLTPSLPPRSSWPSGTRPPP